MKAFLGISCQRLRILKCSEWQQERRGLDVAELRRLEGSEKLWEVQALQCEQHIPAPFRRLLLGLGSLGRGLGRPGEPTEEEVMEEQ